APVEPGSFAVHLQVRTKTSAKVERRFDANQIALLEKLNRADRAHLDRLSVLVAPDRWDLDELAYSPLPHEPRWAYGRAKALVIHVPGQVFGAYENGRLVRWGPVSSGYARVPTPEGLYHLNWKSPGRHSTVDPEWYMRWYFNFGNREGMALHAYALPGKPASHACVRLLERDAVWLYHWGETWELSPDGREVRKPGTPLWIYGKYRFGESPPWLSIDWWRTPLELPAPAEGWISGQPDARARTSLAFVRADDLGDGLVEILPRHLEPPALGTNHFDKALRLVEK
ncbi:MAG: L,D-transpeptidase, partial [Acidobacteria bacterium]|nr:L,D-transpeptidase [Acidobacteriota bacterium]